MSEWTQGDARAWWREHGSALERDAVGPDLSAATRTMVVNAR